MASTAAIKANFPFSDFAITQLHASEPAARMSRSPERLRATAMMISWL